MWFSAIAILALGILPASTLPSKATVPILRLAQAAAPGFEETEAPQVTLEAPKTLERPDVQPPADQQKPGEKPPAESKPVPDWWKASEQSIAEAMTAQSSAQETAAAGQGPTDAGGVQRGLGENVARGFVALCVVLALILLCGYALKRFGRKTPLLAGASLGTVLGRIHLSPKASLHFVRVKDTVLVVGLTPNGLTSIARLDAALFDEGTAKTTEGKPPVDSNDFLPHLKASAQSDSAAGPDHEDDEIAALRGDLARLQRYLQETSRELGD